MSKKLFECEIDYIKENCPYYGVEKVAKALGRGNAIVRSALKKYNVKTPKRGETIDDVPPFFDKEYLIFENRFKTITPELAYWLGFFWADGTIGFGSCMRIEITEEDGNELEKLFLNVFPFFIAKRARRNRKKQMSFSVTDKNIGEMLKKLGKYPNSFESHQKILEYLGDENLVIFFLRGLIDGDGNFYLNESKKYAQFTLASNINQDWSFLLEYLKKFNPNIRTDKTTHGNSSTLRITGDKNVVNFIKFLKYDKIEIGLTRKNLIANKIIGVIENKPIETKKYVLQFEKDGTFVKEWKSILEASKWLGCSKNAIISCCNGISKTSMGYIWRYKDKI